MLRCANVLLNVILGSSTISNTILAMESLTTFSLRIPKDLARRIALEAKRSGLSKSEYARRAMEEFSQQRMQERMAYLSTQLAAHSAAAHDAMESSISDGIV
jgi:predicted DNA-binding protein